MFRRLLWPFGGFDVPSLVVCQLSMKSRDRCAVDAPYFPPSRTSSVRMFLPYGWSPMRNGVAVKTVVLLSRRQLRRV